MESDHRRNMKIDHQSRHTEGQYQNMEMDHCRTLKEKDHDSIGREHGNQIIVNQLWK